MNLKFIYLFILPACFSVPSMAQLSAYTNFQNQFVVWEKGMMRKVEYLVPTQYKIGRNAIPYIDNSRNFKIYHNGASHKINDGFTNRFQVSDNLVTFQNATVLNVWDNGRITLLSRLCDQFFTGDSLVVYFDGVQKRFNAYYNGDIYPIEGFLGASNLSSMFDTDTATVRISNEMDIASGQLPSVKVSDNIAAYVNYANQFRIFYQGNIFEQENYTVTSFDVGRNNVAYVDANREFKIFSKGATTTIDNFPPYSYAAGDDLVAFVGYDNYFKIYYQDSLYNIGYFDPEFIVKDNIVAYRDATGYFKIFYKGSIYTLESYMPSNIIASYHSLAYINRANMLRLFSEGDIYDVTSADLSDWRLDYDVIQYRFGGNMYKIFYKGRTY